MYLNKSHEISGERKPAGTVTYEKDNLQKKKIEIYYKPLQ